jgi:hypothetical protein
MLPILMNGLCKKRNIYTSYVREVHTVTVDIGLALLPGERTTPEYLVRLKEAVNADHNPVIYLSIDPGKSNGVCGYNAKYYPMFMLVIDSEDMILFLHQFKRIEKCITEKYIVYSNKAKQHIGSNLETSRVIGRIESWAKTNDVQLIMQPASDKVQGYIFMQQKPLPKTNLLNHAMDAKAHFYFWAVRTHRIIPSGVMRP